MGPPVPGVGPSGGVGALVPSPVMTAPDPAPLLGHVEAIFVTTKGSRPMERVDQVEAVVGRGLAGDRYAEGTGFYSPWDVCQVTLIAAEDLEAMAAEGFAVADGEHRRNLVTRGLDVHDLRGRTFSVGAVQLAYDRPRPPCGYIQRLTGQPGFTRALGGAWGSPRGGICAEVRTGGLLRVGDAIRLAGGEAPPPLRTLP